MGGWNGSSGTSSASAPKQKTVTPAKKSGVLRGALAGIIIAVLGGAVSWWLLPGDSPVVVKEKTSKPGAITEVTPAPAATRVDVTNEVPVVVEKEEHGLDPSKTTIIHPRTSKTGRVMILMDGTVVTNMPRRIFDRDFEKTLSVVLRPGSMSRGLFRAMRSRYTDEQIVSMLIEPTKPNDDDPDDVRRVKNRVQDLKTAMCEEIKKGRSVSEVLDEIQDQLSRDAMMKATVRSATREAIKTGDAETIRDTVEAGDKLLQEKGLPKQQVSPRYRVPAENESDPESDAVSEESN